MPELSSSKIDYDLDAIPSSTLATFDAAQLIAKTINDAYVEPFRIISESINQAYLEPMRRIGEVFEIYNTQIAKTIAAVCAIDNSIWKNILTPPATNLSSIFEAAEIIEADVNEVSPAQAIPTSLPAVRVQYQQVFENFNMAITIEGRFYFEGKILQNLTTNSKHGQFLKILLTSEQNYVTDEFLIELFGFPDPAKGIGYIRDDLKKYLSREGIRIVLYRNRDRLNKGYKLIRISKLSN
jgi:hypothetical protein